MNYDVLKGKKLLFLGGPAIMCDVVKAAQSMGIYTYTTDWYPPESSPTKLVADKYFMISSADVEAVVELIKKENIDGVITGFTDSALPHYYKICKKAGLPFYANDNQIEVTCDKNKFKKLCKQFDVPVVEELFLGAKLNKEIVNRIKFPVIAKPIDNSGGRGISICHNEMELIHGFDKALSFSPSKNVLLERFMKGKEVSIFYLMVDGEINLVAMGNRHTKNSKQGIIPLPVAYTFPSKYLSQYQKNIDPKVKEMFRSLGIKNGLIFIQSFIEDGECIFYEMGFRLTGSLEYKILEKVAGFNHMELLIHFAITGKMLPNGFTLKPKPNFDKYACNITFLCKPGVIKRIIGIDEIKKINGVIDAVPSYQEGQSVPESAIGTLKQVVLRVFAYAETKDKLKIIIEAIHNTFDVLSLNGVSMLMDKFETRSLYEEI